MAKWQKLTNSSDETSLGSLISGDTVFTIPYFQRPYKWKLERLQQLERDILQLVDGSSDNHFLGAIIVHGRPSNPADPRLYDVIDGQQRITTVFLYICAVVSALCKSDQYDEAVSLFLKYLVINRQTSLITNAKLQTSKDDRRQLNAVIRDLLEDEIFAQRIAPFTYKALPVAGSETGRLLSNYRYLVRFLTNQVSVESIDRLRAIYTALLDRVSVVQIDVYDPINGPKIFDSLNSRQEPMTTGDLIRNEIFSRVSDKNASDVESLDQEYWQPFYQQFKDPSGSGSTFDDYFFPFGLIKNSNLKKSDVYSHLRNLWKDEKEPSIIISDLAAYQSAFLDLENGTNTQQLPSLLAIAVRRMSTISPNSTYPFLMQLCDALRKGELDPAVGGEVLDLLESFLVRRAICGHEPTGLHAVFKGLWADCKGKPEKTNVTSAIRDHKTVAWPGSVEVANCIRTRPLYKSAIIHFLLLEWNRHLGGDQPTVKPWVEHVLPDTPSDYWKSIFHEEVHKQMKDRLANLLPLSQPMNQGLGNSDYPTKRLKYAEDSMYKAARDFAKDYESWTPETLEARSETLGAWAVKRWED